MYDQIYMPILYIPLQNLNLFKIELRNKFIRILTQYVGSSEITHSFRRESIFLNKTLAVEYVPIDHQLGKAIASILSKLLKLMLQ